jgi:hypothetical protein
MNDVEISYNLKNALPRKSPVRDSVAEYGLPRKKSIYNIAKFFFKCYSFSMLILNFPLTLSSLCEGATHVGESVLVKQA